MVFCGDCDDMDSTKGLQSLDNDCDGIIRRGADDNLSSDKDCDEYQLFRCDEYEIDEKVIATAK